MAALQGSAESPPQVQKPMELWEIPNGPVENQMDQRSMSMFDVLDVVDHRFKMLMVCYVDCLICVLVRLRVTSWSKTRFWRCEKEVLCSVPSQRRINIIKICDVL